MGVIGRTLQQETRELNQGSVVLASQFSGGRSAVNWRLLFAAWYNAAMKHAGGCHCGNMRVRLRLSQEPQLVALRACACTFCRMHGTRTVADPAGSFEVWADDWSLVEPYRFGSRTADYLVCRRCGVYIAAVCETSAGLRAVVNVRCLDDRGEFTQPPSAPDYDGETTEARLSRRAGNWMPAIVHR